MPIVCPNCDAEYQIEHTQKINLGQEVKCSNCDQDWFHYSIFEKKTNRSNTIKALAEEEYWITTQNTKNTKKETDVKIRLKATSDRLTETKNNLKNEPTSNLPKRISIDNSTILGFSLISLVSTILAVLYVSYAEIQNTFSQENIFLADYKIFADRVIDTIKHSIDNLSSKLF
jgi:predicted Zn finger-like uncharacterized protein